MLFGKKFQRKFALSDQGVANVKKGTLWTVIVNLVVMGGMGILYLLMMQFMDTLVQGAELPNAVVYMRHTDDWNDADKAAAVTAALLDAHDIDVLTQHVNPVTPLQVAQERGVWTIGNNFDNRELFADSYLTACVFDWEPFFRARLNDCERNRFIGKNYWGSLRTGMVALSPLTAHCDERAQQAVDEELSRLLDGSFDVFYGPIVDSHGTERVRAGENLSDEQLLYHMDWFVDGVVAE